MNKDALPSLCRFAYTTHLESEWQRFEQNSSSLFFAIRGLAGSGKRATVEHWLSNRQETTRSFITSGNYITDGYFAGFYPLFLTFFQDAEQNHPLLIERHEHSLKRLFPFLHCSVYRTPFDLTNQATHDERTRFYHYEYQEKLLNGAYEFFCDYCETTASRFILVIDNAHLLSPTVKTFLQIMIHRQRLACFLSLILLADEPLPMNLAHACHMLTFEPLTPEEATPIVRSCEGFAQVPLRQLELYWQLSQGNLARLIALLSCSRAGLQVVPYLSLEAHIDFYLHQQGDKFRYQLLQTYIEHHCVSDDPIVIRNYQTYHPEIKSSLHRQQIDRLQQEQTGERYMRLVHYFSLKTTTEQVMALAPVTIKLQEIGLYDTWFDLFSSYYTNTELRVLPDGEQLHNVSFIRMAFVLYSLGLAHLSLSYLETFYHHFPESLFTPMVLYAQSMTYGRYQIPVDLEKAEHYALLNLQKIDTTFRNHPRYAFIKVFAENALAYIRARQGRFDEALRLCATGVEQLSSVYGDQQHALQRSILIYNIGQVYELKGDFEQAHEAYQQAIALDPYYGEYYNDMANLLQKFGKYEEALPYYQQAIALCPPYYEAHLNRAYLYVKMNEHEKAAADYTRVIELKPTEARAYLGLGILALHRDEYQQALEFFASAIYYDPRNAQAYSNRALALLSLEQYDQAKDDLDQALHFNKKLDEALNNRAILAFKRGEYEQSLADLNQAIALKPDVDYFLNRGIVLHKLERHQEAAEDFEQARSMGLADTEIQQRLAETLST